MQTIYVESDIIDHKKTQQILSKYASKAHVIECKHFGEVFNPKAQDFRLQKQQPSLILAKKTGHYVLPTPEGFGIGSQENYYFSHMLNCLYDCRYCFLQGMYPSANQVLFVNFEDFTDAIANKVASLTEPAYFFSGYDCDSLAFEGVSGFLQHVLPFFKQHPNAILELRTKSTNIRELLRHEAYDNCVVAFSFTPDIISQKVEHKVPSVAKRIIAMQKLADAGWNIGLRFDPLIYAENFEDIYASLIADIFRQVPKDAIHSVSIGPLRFPAKMYHKLVKLYPEDELLAHPLYKRDNHFSYQEEVEQIMKRSVIESLQAYVPDALIFECNPL